jgi:hypothetical protein
MPAKTAPDAIAFARRYVGTTEQPPGSNRTPFGQWYGTDGVAWCAIFASFIVTGLCEVVMPGATTKKGFAYTPYMEREARKRGRWVEPTALEPGDLVLFQFDDDPQVDHVGLFVRWASKGVAVTIEGNTSSDDRGSQSNGGGVYERRRPVKVIRGAYRPPYAPTAPSSATKAQPKAKPQPRLLMLTSPQQHGQDVRDVALALKRHGHDVGKPLDVFGPQYDRAVRAFQRRHGLKPDGVVGAATRAKLGA